MHALEEFTASCPYCGEPISLLVDLSAGEQDYIEDCFVCCRPIQVTVAESERGAYTLRLQSENDS